MYKVVEVGFIHMDLLLNLRILHILTKTAKKEGEQLTEATEQSKYFYSVQEKFISDA